MNPREYNQPLPGTGPASTWIPAQQRRPLYSVLPLVTNISGTDSSSVMNYHALQLSGRKRLSHGLEFLAAYTLSKTLTDNLGYYGSAGVNTTGAYWQNAYNRQADYGRSFFDARHNFSLGGFVELPIGRGRYFGKAGVAPWIWSSAAGVSTMWSVCTAASRSISGQRTEARARTHAVMPVRTDMGD